MHPRRYSSTRGGGRWAHLKDSIELTGRHSVMLETGVPLRGLETRYLLLFIRYYLTSNVSQSLEDERSLVWTGLQTPREIKKS